MYLFPVAWGRNSEWPGLGPLYSWAGLTIGAGGVRTGLARVAGLTLCPEDRVGSQTEGVGHRTTRLPFLFPGLATAWVPFSDDHQRSVPGSERFSHHSSRSGGGNTDSTGHDNAERSARQQRQTLSAQSAGGGLEPNLSPSRRILLEE